jgi:hypothetical protein
MRVLIKKSLPFNGTDSFSMDFLDWRTDTQDKTDN